ncbi:P-loop containing nucleoside triphosphate hydrolase protein, partial [Dimargaris cristalligena]
TEIVQTGLTHGSVPYCWGPYVTGLSQAGVTVPPVGSTAHLFPTFRQLRDILLAFQMPTTQALHIPSTVLLHGPPGVGKRATVAWAADYLGFHRYTVTASELLEGNPSDVQLRGALATHLEQAAKYTPGLFIIEHLDALVHSQAGLERQEEPPIVHTLMGLFQEVSAAIRQRSTVPGNSRPQLHYPLIMVGLCSDASKLPASLSQWFQQELEIGAPAEKTRQTILQSLMGRHLTSPDVTLHTVALETASFLPSDLVQLTTRACLAAWSQARRAGGIDTGPTTTTGTQSTSTSPGSSLRPLLAAGVAVGADHWTQALAETRTEVSDSLGVPKIPNVTWDDVGGLQSVKQDILDTVQLPLEHPELFAQGVKKRSGILLYGPPGTGKTLLAKAVATSCSLNFFSVKGPELLNMYIGESEANVRRVFQKARDARPCVIFFDELDSLAPKRGQQGDSGGVMDRIVSQLLAELDGMSGGGSGGGDFDNGSGNEDTQPSSSSAGAADIFVIGATNRPDLLDPALLRPGRFDKLVYLGISENHTSQLSILEALTRKFNLAPDWHLADVANRCPFNYTGADFYALCSDAMLKAMIRQGGEAEAGNRRLPRIHPITGKPLPRPMTAQYFLEHLASEDDTNILVQEDDFIRALDELVPSVPMEEIRRYKQIQSKFNQGVAEN